MVALGRLEWRPTRGGFVRADDGADFSELPSAVSASPAEHIVRLDRLIADQADELARQHASLLEVTALCDLADWANESNPEAGPAVVRVDDLRRILARPAPDPVPPGS
jgi:hypothetical protein